MILLLMITTITTFSFLLLFSFTIHINLLITTNRWRQRIRRFVGLMIHGLIQSAATFIAFNIHIEIRATDPLLRNRN